VYYEYNIYNFEQNKYYPHNESSYLSCIVKVQTCWLKRRIQSYSNLLHTQHSVGGHWSYSRAHVRQQLLGVFSDVGQTGNFQQLRQGEQRRIHYADELVGCWRQVQRYLMQTIRTLSMDIFKDIQKTFLFRTVYWMRICGIGEFARYKSPYYYYYYYHHHHSYVLKWCLKWTLSNVYLNMTTHATWPACFHSPSSFCREKL